MQRYAGKALGFRYPLRKVKIRDGRNRLSLIKEKREMFMAKICPLCRTEAELSDGSPIRGRQNGPGVCSVSGMWKI